MSSKKHHSEKNTISSEKNEEFSSDIFILDENSEKEQKIIGFDDIKIPSFLNDIQKDENIDKLLQNYYKIKEELGSPELVELYLVDFNRLIKVCKGKNKNWLRKYHNNGKIFANLNENNNIILISKKNVNETKKFRIY